MSDDMKSPDTADEQSNARHKERFNEKKVV